MGIRGHAIVVWTDISTLVVEAITAYPRFHKGISAVEFNKTAPLLLQIHHMIYSLPLLAVLPLVWRKPRLSGALLGIGIRRRCRLCRFIASAAACKNRTSRKCRTL